MKMNAERAGRPAAVKTARRTESLKKAVKTKKQIEAERQKSASEWWERERQKVEVFTDLFISWAKGNAGIRDKRAMRIITADEFLTILLKIVLRANVVIYNCFGESEDDFMPLHFERVVNALTDSVASLRWTEEKPHEKKIS